MAEVFLEQQEIADDVNVIVVRYICVFSMTKYKSHLSLFWSLSQKNKGPHRSPLSPQANVNIIYFLFRSKT